MCLDGIVSIIVPVYNAEKYLVACLNSVLSQSYQNIEILIINDGSTDQSGRICEQFAKKDKRIRLFHKKNGGVSSARNLGLEQAGGDYITFVDADDFIHREYVRILIQDINDFQADIVQCGFFERYSDGTGLRKTKSRSYRKILDNQFNYCKNGDIGFAGGKLFRKESLDGIKFDEEISMSEDALFMAHVMKKRKVIYYEKKILYLYRIHLNSSMQLASETSNFTALKARKLIFKMQEKGSPAFYSAGMQYLEMCRRIAAELWLLDRSDDKRIGALKKKVKENRFLIWKANENIMQKILLLLFIYAPKSYFKIFFAKKKKDKENLIRKSK